jgi:phenylpropionate dioxygenase-like ring-hydroxylating dioxygenase large terminal subunit
MSAPDSVTSFSTEPYISADYCRREKDRLWSRVWQWACRLEEIPRVGDFVTYDIMDESIIVVRSGEKQIKAFYNVCLHRGRRLTKDCGHVVRFVCKFHGWKWDLEGNCIHVLDRHDFGDALNDEVLRLGELKVDTWGGYVFVTMDPDPEPLRDYLEPATTLLAAYEFEKLRFRWRKSLIAHCNWKVALEAFSEAYHVQGTHPQLLEWTDDLTVSQARGRHGTFSHAPFPKRWLHGQGSQRIFREPRADTRQALSALHTHLLEELDASQSHSMAEAAQRLPRELPATATPMETLTTMMRWTREIDAKKGVSWPPITPEQMKEAGNDWHMFPNWIMLPGPTYMLGYRARPNGFDPDSCIFEVYAMDRIGESAVEPRVPAWQFNNDPTDREFWGMILLQDFQNMAEIQKGLKSRGLSAVRFNPQQEVSLINFHRVLSEYMQIKE